MASLPFQFVQHGQSPTSGAPHSIEVISHDTSPGVSNVSTNNPFATSPYQYQNYPITQFIQMPGHPPHQIQSPCGCNSMYTNVVPHMNYRQPHSYYPQYMQHYFSNNNEYYHRPYDRPQQTCHHLLQQPSPPPVLPSPPRATVQRREPTPYFQVRESNVPKFSALLIGITYESNPTHSKVFGANADLLTAYEFLTERLGVPAIHITILTDCAKLLRTPSIYFPGCECSRVLNSTRSNIELHLQALVQSCSPGDLLFMTYSGHGGRTVEEPGQETDEYNENIVPCDAMGYKGVIHDNWLYSLVRNLPRDVKLICLFDACRCGSILDLPVYFQFEQTQDRFAHSNITCYQHLELENPNSLGNVFCFSAGYEDEDVSDINHPRKRAGPLNTAFFEVLRDLLSDNVPLRYRKVMNTLRNHELLSTIKDNKSIEVHFSSLKLIDVDETNLF